MTKPTKPRSPALRHAHPEWIVRALRQSLVNHGRPKTEIDALLEADNAAPVVNLVALPGLGNLDEAFDNGATAGELVEDSALSAGGDLGRFESVRRGTTRVQDVGSQLVARALAGVELGDLLRKVNDGWTCAPAPEARLLFWLPWPTATAQLSWPTSLHRTGRNSFSKPSRLFRRRPGRYGPVMVVKWVRSSRNF